MAVSDTGIIGAGTGQVGRWVENITAGGRKRTLMVYMRDEKDNANDQSYIGYYSDLSKAGKGCSAAISIGGDNVYIQTVSTGKDAKVNIREIPVEKFMDMLDILVS